MNKMGRKAVEKSVLVATVVSAVAVLKLRNE
jgi:hypothetical protein